VPAVLIALVVVTLSSSLLGGRIFTSGDNIFVFPPFSAEHPPDWVRPSNSLLGDPLLGFNPDLIQIRSDLRKGVLPLWNPYAAAGRPLLGSQQSAPLFPLTWLAFILPFWSSLAWIAAAKILVAGAGTYLLCRELALQRAPSLLGAIAFAFGTYFFAWLEHPHTNVWAMLPWALLATRRVCSRGSGGAAALLGTAIGLAWLGGQPESAFFVLAPTVAFGAFELIAERARGPSGPSSAESTQGNRWKTTLVRRTALLTCGLALGIGVGTIVTAPLVELLGQSGKVVRGLPPFPFSDGRSFFFPELSGMPNNGTSTAGPGNFNRAAYVGALPLLLAMGSLGRRRPREQWFFVAIAAMLLATIFDTPLAHGIRKLPYGNVPALDRLLIVLSLTGAILGAYGLDRWIGGTRQERRHMRWIMIMTASLPVLVWLVKHHGALSHLGSAIVQLPAARSVETSSPSGALGSVWRWVLLCAIGLALLSLVPRRSVVITLIIVLTAADLIILDRGYHGSITAAEANPRVPGTIRYLQTHQGDSRALPSDIALPADLPERYDLRDARMGVIVPDTLRHRLLWTALGGTDGDQEFFNASSRTGQRLADLFATRYVLLPSGMRPPSWLHVVFTSSGGSVALNTTALPRAWVAYDWRRARSRSDALAATVASSTATLLKRPVIEASSPPQSMSAQPPSVARVMIDRAENVTVKATAPRAGYLVLEDSAYPGWRASVDGRAAVWHPANENFRAVPIPAGTHVVNFNYQPKSVLTGALASAVCALILAVFALIGLRGNHALAVARDVFDRRRAAQP